MSKVALVIDNSAGMGNEALEKLNPANVLPISFMINGEEFYEGKNMSYSQFYDFLKDKTATVSTSQPSAEVVKEGWREVLKTYDEIVYIVLSSALSEACNTAINASREEEFAGKVFVVDNGRVSILNRVAMFQAKKMIEQGKSAKEIKEYLEQTKTQCKAFIAVDTLKYLKKGGRITPAAAAIGTLLNIKPILEVGNGKLDSCAKVMSMKQAKQKLIAIMKKEIEEKYPEELKNGQVLIALAHSQEDLNSAELKQFEEEVKEAFGLPIYCNDPLPLFVVCHTGPGALAAGYVIDRIGIV